MKLNCIANYSSADLSFRSVLLLSLIAPIGLVAQDLPFSSGSNGSDGPLVIPVSITALDETNGVFDAARSEIIVFGGMAGSTSRVDTTWAWDGGNWIPKVTATTPPARNNHMMAFDAARGEVVMYGGMGPTGRLADTWVWNGVDWTNKTTATNPGFIEDAAMVYDPVRQEVVLFGGFDGASTRRDATWVWNGTTWTQRNPATKATGRSGFGMVWDAAEQRVLIFGGQGPTTNVLNDTWSWNGTTWSTIATPVAPASTYDFGMAYHPGLGKTVLFGSRTSGTHNATWLFDSQDGWVETYPLIEPFGGLQPNFYDNALVYDGNTGLVLQFSGYERNVGVVSRTMGYDGQNWKILGGSAYYFDMRDRPSGVWNFTTIDIPSGTTVRFVKNEGNTPVVWLASGAVNINGTLDVSGQNGFQTPSTGQYALAGPGGFDGGAGGIAFQTSGTYAGSPGQGPGGGGPGTVPADTTLRSGVAGSYYNTYGNTFIVPLLGGSGGGGAVSSDTFNGAGGGAGGGAVLIASSRDLTLNGSILAKGGNRVSANSATSGYGSGGAVKLVADRLLGSGIIDVRGGGNQQGNLLGRIRLEAFERPLQSNNHLSLPSASSPVLNNLAVFLANQPALTISNVAGAAVRQPPSGSTSNPDVVFSDGGSVSITVQGSNIPDGTQVNLRVTFPGNSVLLGPVNMNANSATFTSTFPSGVGTLQAFAEFVSN